MRLALIAILALAGCASDVTSPDRHFLETVFLQPETVRAGASVIVQVTIQNTTDQPQIYDQNVCVPFVVADSTGADVTPSAVCSAVLYPPRTLGPHEQAVYVFGWVTDVQRNSFPVSPPMPLPTGTYMISGAMQGSDILVVPVALHVIP